MDETKYNQWIKKILATEDEEISCSDCFDHISEYVEIEASGAQMNADLQKVSQHIHQCQVCYEEYDLLRNLLYNTDEE